MKGHGYWYANDVISTDVTLALRYPIPPAERCLVPLSSPACWGFTVRRCAGYLSRAAAKRRILESLP
jgi:hypothetical protein